MLKKLPIMVLFVMATSISVAQTTYDSKTLVDTNSNSTSTSTVNTNNVNSGTITNINQTTVGSTSLNTNNNNNTSTSTNVNTNNNVNSGTMTNINQNTNSGTLTYNNNNNNSGTVTNVNQNTSSSTSENTNKVTSTNTNNNNNVNSGTMTNINQNTSENKNTNANTNENKNVNTGDMTNRNINETNITQRVIQPPPTAVAPTMMSGGNADLCSTGTSGSVQTQIFGVSGGGTVRDMNCERLKLAKTLYDMGMKVAAVATMCQDRRIFDAMLAAGTPCPYEGMIGEQAKAAWEENKNKIPKMEEPKIDDTYQKVGIGALLGALVFKLF
jgi:hypothetical protein